MGNDGRRRVSRRSRAAAALARAAAALALTAAGTVTAAADPAVWQVNGARGAELFLLGSVHVLRREDYPLPTSVDRLFERADELVMELDLDDADLAEQQQHHRRTYRLQ